MFHSYAKYLFTPVVCLLAGFSSLAQNIVGENSPYSRFGIGEQRNGVNTLLKGMGSISSAYVNPFAVNTDNPASYAAIRLTTYEAGGEGSTRTVKTATDKYTTGMATLTHLNVGIPIGKNGGIAFGLKPNTRVYYLLQDTVMTGSVGKSLNTFNGNGGTNYGFIGAGYRYKGFSLGANFGYIFGTINHFKEITGIDTFKVNHARFANSTRIGGIYWKAGALYETNFNKKLGMRAGATFAASQNVTARRDEYWYSVASAAPTIYDTAYSLTDVKSSTIIPMTYSAGFHLVGIDKWMAGVEFSGASWGEFRNFGMVDSVNDNAYRIGVGGEYTPNMASITRYFDRVTYRLGFSYGQDYVRLRNTDINYYSATVGMSLPFRRATDRIHTAFEIGSRGTTANGLLRETFTRFSLGISLNDRWFIKRRYD